MSLFPARVSDCRVAVGSPLTSIQDTRRQGVEDQRGRAGLGLCELRASRRGDAQQGCVQKSRDGQGGGAWSCWHRR